MEIERRTEGKIMVCELIGQLESESAIELHQSFREWATVPESYVALGLSGISFIDSTGIGAIVSAHKQLKQAGKHLCFVGAMGQPAEMLSFLRVDKVIPSYADLAAMRKGEKL